MKLWQLIDKMAGWWENITYPQDEEMNKRVKELKKKYEKENK